MRTLSLAFAALAVASLPVRADDTSAVLAAGELVLEKTDRIALAAEDLYLSEQVVRIDYRFRNLADADIETTVAFPMPDITGDPATLVSIPDPARDNFLRVATEVDGRLVESQVEQRAFLARSGSPPVEITDRLKALDIPLMPTVEATEVALRRIGEGQRRALAEAGILERQVHKDGTIADVPVWRLTSKLWHRQVFPAGREIVVRQSYAPSLGGQSSLSFGSPDLDPSQQAQYVARFCTDAAFEKVAQALYRRASADGSRAFQAYEQYLTHVIASGDNRAGPIGTFRLVVDKGDPATLVSFCGSNVKKTGPTTYEMVAKDYVPQRDIDVLFLKIGHRG
ncbi:DUF4424 domain-containing protein [Methylobacterium sp. J-048]|uniref:DUF4424 domain-containing protein n=1 Tax=Methylobacterium sp. J-048 TaxID=2836635 RepID=UPI001FBA9640|nr:DUF4424 domain-containing protein [Methylobacterium sp. J-048]MCJ2060501.1 DUF4424 domain-containing protein [Methylobacterium sp. J-048]